MTGFIILLLCSFSNHAILILHRLWAKRYNNELPLKTFKILMIIPFGYIFWVIVKAVKEGYSD
jgi:hypothetical protein